MRVTSVFFISLVILLAAGYVMGEYINDANRIDAINSIPNLPWKAGANKKFDGMTVQEYMRRLIQQQEFVKPAMIKNVNKQTVKKAVPESYDVRAMYPDCISVQTERDEGQCGSTAQLNTAASLADRLCIATNGSTNLILSTEYILACDRLDFGCSGAQFDTLWKYLTINGTTTETCFPYTSAHGDVANCPRTCKDGSAIRIFKVDPASIQQFSGNVVDAQIDIMTYGSIPTGMEMYMDFETYTAGVYVPTTTQSIGLSAARVLGWGVDSVSGLPYWLADKGWGTHWGSNGYFKILRGKDTCKFETYMTSGRLFV